MRYHTPRISQLNFENKNNVECYVFSTLGWGLAPPFCYVPVVSEIERAPEWEVLVIQPLHDADEKFVVAQR